MIYVTKDEKEKILEVFPDAHIAIINRFKKSKRKKYFVNENDDMKKIVAELRKQ